MLFICVFCEKNGEKTLRKLFRQFAFVCLWGLNGTIVTKNMMSVGTNRYCSAVPYFANLQCCATRVFSNLLLFAVGFTLFSGKYNLSKYKKVCHEALNGTIITCQNLANQCKKKLFSKLFFIYFSLQHIKNSSKLEDFFSCPKRVKYSRKSFS